MAFRSRGGGLCGCLRCKFGLRRRKWTLAEKIDKSLVCRGLGEEGILELGKA